MTARINRANAQRADIALRRLLVPAKAKPSATPVDASRARITVCAPFVDRRFTADAGHVGEFSRAGIGRYVEPDDEIETEGMGL